ncbi:hypothetical protein G1K67_13510 [Tenacibaculum finnmarkense]|nr:hypothetical protein [Tenacibaculum finnmarkense]
METITKYKTMFFHFKNSIDIDQKNQDSIKKDLFWNNFSKETIDYSDELFKNYNLPSNFFIEENYTNTNIDENLLNKKRQEYLNVKVSPILISFLTYEDVDYGVRSEGEKIICEQIEQNSVVALNWINELYIQNFSNEKILVGLLRILGNLDEDDISSIGHVIALASLSHSNTEIKELGVRAFENWSSSKSYSILSNVKVGEKWLQEYINQVIKDLEIDLCLSL